MKLIVLFFAAMLAAFGVQAAPFLLADAPPASVTIDSVRYTVNGGAPIACVLEAGRPKCDLGQLTTAGTYTLVVTWCSPGGIVNTPTGATNTVAGCASSSPFAYRLLTAAVPGPMLSVSP